MKILITRFSSFGDVAIAVPLLQSIRTQYPEIQIIFVTKSSFKKIIEIVEGVEIYTPDFQKKHKGLFGLIKLFNDLKKYNPDYYVDLHDVIRTKILRNLFSLFTNTKITKLDKLRKEKRKLIRRKNKRLYELPKIFSQYQKAFNFLDINYICTPILNFTETENYIVVAPFAAHENKIYPIEKMQKLLEILSKNYKIYILGNGKNEQKLAYELQLNSNIESIIGKYTFEKELEIIGKAKCIITMDSANMHIAALTPTKIFSIWGPTHPFIGFTPYRDENVFYIQKDLSCRPCSVFGNKKCFRKDHECMNITPEEIAKKIFSNI